MFEESTVHFHSQVVLRALITIGSLTVENVVVLVSLIKLSYKNRWRKVAFDNPEKIIIVRKVRRHRGHNPFLFNRMPHCVNSPPEKIKRINYKILNTGIHLEEMKKGTSCRRGFFLSPYIRMLSCFNGFMKWIWLIESDNHKENLFFFCVQQVSCGIRFCPPSGVSKNEVAPFSQHKLVFQQHG